MELTCLFRLTKPAARARLESSSMLLMARRSLGKEYIYECGLEWKQKRKLNVLIFGIVPLEVDRLQKLAAV